MELTQVLKLFHLKKKVLGVYWWQEAKGTWAKIAHAIVYC